MFIMSTVLSHTMLSREDVQPYSQLLTAQQVFFIRVGRQIAPPVHNQLSGVLSKVLLSNYCEVVADQPFTYSIIPDPGWLGAVCC